MVCSGKRMSCSKSFIRIVAIESFSKLCYACKKFCVALFITLESILFSWNYMILTFWHKPMNIETDTMLSRFFCMQKNYLKIHSKLSTKGLYTHFAAFKLDTPSNMFVDWCQLLFYLFRKHHCFIQPYFSLLHKLTAPKM